MSVSGVCGVCGECEWSVWGVCGECVESVNGVCGECEGSVQGVCGECVGRMWGVWRGVFGEDVQGLVLSRDFSNGKHVSFVVLSVFGKFFVNSTSSHIVLDRKIWEEYVGKWYTGFCGMGACSIRDVSIPLLPLNIGGRAYLVNFPPTPI